MRAEIAQRMFPARRMLAEVVERLWGEFPRSGRIRRSDHQRGRDALHNLRVQRVRWAIPDCDLGEYMAQVISRVIPRRCDFSVSQLHVTARPAADGGISGLRAWVIARHIHRQQWLRGRNQALFVVHRTPDETTAAITGSGGGDGRSIGRAKTRGPVGDTWQVMVSPWLGVVGGFKPMRFANHTYLCDVEMAQFLRRVTNDGTGVPMSTGRCAISADLPRDLRHTLAHNLMSDLCISAGVPSAALQREAPPSTCAAPSTCQRVRGEIRCTSRRRFYRSKARNLATRAL